MLFTVFVQILCIAIMLATIWAVYSHKVCDGLPLKIALGFVNLAAYFALAHASDRTFMILGYAIIATALAALFQRYVMRSRILQNHRHCAGKHGHTA